MEAAPEPAELAALEAWMRRVDAQYHQQYARTAFSATFLAAPHLHRLVAELQLRMQQHVRARLELDEDLAQAVVDFAVEQSAHTFLPPSAEEATRIFLDRYFQFVVPGAFEERRHARYLQELAHHGGEAFHRRRTYVRSDVERPVESTLRHIGTDTTDYMLAHPYGQQPPSPPSTTTSSRAPAKEPGYHRAQPPTASSYGSTCGEGRASSGEADAWWPDVGWRA